MDELTRVCSAHVGDPLIGSVAMGGCVGRYVLQWVSVDQVIASSGAPCHRVWASVLNTIDFTLTM